MQGQRSAVGSLPEVLGFDHGSTSTDTGFDQQMHWNSIRNSSQNRMPDYMISSTNTSVGYLNAVNQPGQNLSGWDFGESSSRGGQGEGCEIDQKPEHEWSCPINVSADAALRAEGQQYGSSNIVSVNNVGVNMHSNENANGTLFVRNSGSETIPRDLNMNSDFIADEDDDCQVLECPNAFKSSGSVNERIPSASSSSNPFGMSSGTGGFLVEEGYDGRPGCSLDGQRLSCKRKTLEGYAGQSSGSGSSSFIQLAESSLWHAAPARHNASSSTSTVTPIQSNLGLNLPEQVNPRLGLSVGRSSSDNPPTLTASGTAESSRRNCRLRINASHPQNSLHNNMFSTETDIGNSNMSSAQHSLRLLTGNNSLDLRPASAIDNGSPQGQSVVVHVSSVRRNPNSRWNGASGSRTGSSSGFAISGDRDAAPYEESSSASMPRNLSEHPMFVPPTEMRNASQNPPNWNLAGGNASNTRNVVSTSRTVSSAAVHSSTPTWTPHRNPSQYPRRLSEFVRRSLSSSADTESGGQSSNYPSLRSVPSSQEMAFPSGSGSHGRHASSSRSAMLLERHLDTAFGTYSLRNLAAATEGRNRLMSEIRNVLDLMRRGEGLRFEDVMVLDQSVSFGMPDIHDRHRDMRLDVDNMSYEELLALEERIGNVSTGLSEETILKQLKHRKYVSNKTDEVETEPCCVCQEDYTDGEDLGALDCGHDFHAECIKRWLTNKNLCPICKTMGLAK